METFQRYWPFVPGIYRLPVKYPQQSQWGGDLMFSLICAGTNGWDTGDFEMPSRSLWLQCNDYRGTRVQGCTFTSTPPMMWISAAKQALDPWICWFMSSNSLRMYIISHTICTRLWCAALFCGYIIRSQQIHSFTHILQGYITGTWVVIVSQGHG